MSNLLRGLAATLILLGACGPSGGGDDIQGIDAPVGGNIDAPSGNVAAPSGTIDAPSGGAGIGSACPGDGEGSCPAGFECLNLTGGSGSWCSKQCTGVSDQSCSVGY